MNINNIYVTQRKLRNPSQLIGMIVTIGKGDPLPPIILAEYEDGIEIEDGHHRSLAFWLSGREKLMPGEYILIQREWSRKRRFGKLKDLLDRTALGETASRLGHIQ